MTTKKKLTEIVYRWSDCYKSNQQNDIDEKAGLIRVLSAIIDSVDEATRARIFAALTED